MAAMKRCNPEAKWVIQGWTENPRPQLLSAVRPGELVILDLFSECRPMWGIPSVWKRENGYEDHDWLFCMLENFGANVGLHGRLDQLIDNFRQTKSNPLARNLKGVGLTMEGSGNNPVMFELMCELPWMGDSIPSKEEWIAQYVKSRYGADDRMCRPPGGFWPREYTIALSATISRAPMKAYSAGVRRPTIFR